MMDAWGGGGGGGGGYLQKGVGPVGNSFGKGAGGRKKKTRQRLR